MISSCLMRPKFTVHKFKYFAHTRFIGVEVILLIGQQYGDLTVLSYAGKKKTSSVSKYETPHYLCECRCGNQLEVSEPSLDYNIVKDCGCNKYRRKIVK